MEINSRGSSATRSSEPTENASLIDNQEPIHVSVDDETQDQLEGAAAAAATEADPPLVAVGDPTPTIMESGPPPDGPPPVYYPQGELPPPYHVAATLPTYEEAELIKGRYQYLSIYIQNDCISIIVLVVLLKLEHLFPYK